MAEIPLAVAGIFLSIASSASSIGKWFDGVVDLKKFVENKKTTLKRLGAEINSWTVIIAIIEKSQGPRGSASEIVSKSCLRDLYKYRSRLREIRDKVKKYDGIKTLSTVVNELQELFDILRKEDLENKAKNCLKMMGVIYNSDTIDQLLKLQNTSTAQQRGINNIESSQADIKATQLEMMSMIQESLRKREAPSTMRPQLFEKLELVNRTVENLQDSLLRPSDELKDESLEDSCSSDDDATTWDTADTTLNDVLSGEARKTPKSTYLSSDHGTMTETLEAPKPTSLSSDHGTMTEAPVISPPFKALLSTALRQNHSQIHSAASEDIDTEEDGSPRVAGCFYQTSPSQFPVLKVSADDWNEGFHFGFGNTSAEGVVSFHIGLPETQQDELPQAWKDGSLLIEGNFTTRRFSVILSPVARADKIAPLNLFRRSTLQVKKFKLLLHWNLMDVGTKAKVYHRLAKLESIYQKVETVHCERFASQAPILDDRIVCITIPWKKYQQWTQGMSKDAALDALWEQGILATLPVLVSLRDGTLDPRVWCESKTKRHGRNVTQFNEKSVHAIFQEYTYNGLCFPEDHELCETRFIIVIHNTAQAHDWVDFIRRSQSKDPMCVTHFDSLALDSESIVKRFMDYHSQKPNTSSG
ncbi:unnamed protein product [Fusarium graminearum]|uniref:Uncharacterized protein n=1 Tax=Gibberella zeae TaxID=5518 RepID=A0A4U9EUS7_GIBZA|nr:unnamed protein product [Fusarium graminearum]VTO84403.1 unnamed protein product [Fusarium graminearum]